MHNLSSRTIRRRLEEDGILKGDLTDQEIDDIVKSIQEEMPTAGYEILWGVIRAMGLKVTRDK
jgi:hypothetical protein